MNTLDSEKDIQKAAEKLAKNNGYSRIHALSMLLSKYQSEKRLEEAVIVRRLIHREKSKAKAEKKVIAEKETSYYDDT
jgi:hypothetical protein